MRPLVRGVLESPAAVKTLLGNRALVSAFLNSPAVSDAKAVGALKDSALMMYILSSPGVKAAVQDPVFMRAAFAGPEAITWFVAHPEAAAALRGLMPGLAGSRL
jgi:hypothetical protein